MTPTEPQAEFALYVGDQIVYDAIGPRSVAWENILAYAEQYGADETCTAEEVIRIPVVIGEEVPAAISTDASAWLLEWTFNGEDIGSRLHETKNECTADQASNGGKCLPLYKDPAGTIARQAARIAELEAAVMHGGGFCVFCKTVVPPLPGFLLNEVMRGHVEMCPEHPLAKARAEIKVLRESLQWIYDETAEYITANKMGDVHHNGCMRAARAALSFNQESPPNG